MAHSKTPGTCDVCDAARDTTLVAAPFAPVSIAWKCASCDGLTSTTEVALLLGAAQRHFDRRQRYLVATLTLPMLLDHTVVPAARILALDSPPDMLATFTWVRRAAHRVDEVLTATADARAIDADEIAAMCRTDLLDVTTPGQRTSPPTAFD